MCFNQKGDIYTLYGGSLKLVDKLTFLGNNVSSTENDINMQLGKAWTAIDRLSVKWKLSLSDKIDVVFSMQRSCQYYYMDTPHGRWLSV